MRATLTILVVMLLLPISSSATIYAVGLSKNKIVVAADSRQTEDSGKQSDQACKLTVLGGEIAFVQDGMIGYQGKTNFDGYLIAKRQYDKRLAEWNASMVKPGRSFTEWFADRWADRMASAFFRAAERDLPEWRKHTRVPGGEVNTIGIFVGFDDGGAIAVVEKIACLPGSGPCEQKRIKQIHRGDAADLTAWMTFGVVDLSWFDQIGAWNKWTSWASADPEVTDRRIALDIVKLSATHPKYGKLVGGATDMVELHRTGSLRWIQRKVICSGK